MDDCKSLKPSICGKGGIEFPPNGCGAIRFTGLEDVTINQGIGIDLTEGVKAYDKNGNELSYTVSPDEIDICAVGEFDVEYTATGADTEIIPSFCLPKIGVYLPCSSGEGTVTETRHITIEEIDPPTIDGLGAIVCSSVLCDAETGCPTVISPNTEFDPLEGITATDGNGNELEIEYLGTYLLNESGSVVSFETDALAPDGQSVLPAKSVVVGIEPVQDGTPFIDSVESVPYLKRSVTGSGNAEYDELVGGTVCWNQLCPTRNVGGQSSESGITMTNGMNGRISFSGTATANGIFYLNGTIYPMTFIANHRYLLSFIPLQTAINGIAMQFTPTNTYITSGGKIVTPTSTTSTNGVLRVNVSNGTSIADYEAVIGCHDLTQMFGSTIADYIYGLEQSNAGAGVAFFKKLFPKPYYAYNAGELMSVNAVSHDMVGVNAWDMSTDNIGKVLTENGDLGTNNSFATSDYIKVIPNATYFFKDVGPSANVYTFAEYDADKAFIRIQQISGASMTNASGTKTMSENTHYVRVTRFKTSTESCINLSWSGYRNGEYEEYKKHSYPLDSTLELRGIPKLDASNNLYYDGDTYEPDGTVTRRYGIVDLGTVEWYKGSAAWYTNSLRGIIKPPITNSSTANILISKIQYKNVSSNGDSGVAGTYEVIVSSAGQFSYRYPMDAYADATAFKTAMSGVYLVYELATPTTESAQAFTSPQTIEVGGTEEYTTANIVPVGHNSRRAGVYPISGWDEVETVVSPTTTASDGTTYTTPLVQNVWDEEWEVGSINGSTGAKEAGDSNTIRSKNFIPCLPNTQYYVNKWGNNGIYYIYLYDADKNYLGDSATSVSGKVLTTPANAHYMMFRCYVAYGTTYNNDIEILYPPIADKTVYGGTLDVVSGVLTVDRAIKMLDGDAHISQISERTNTVRVFYGSADIVPTIKPNSSATITIMADRVTVYAPDYVYSNDIEGLSENRNSIAGGLWLGIDKSLLNTYTVSGAKAYLAQNPIQVVYMLKTPQTYQLTPQEVSLFLGQNNVWSDSGDTTVVYWHSIPQDGAYEYSEEGRYTITYRAEDECGHETTAIREIIVEES